MPVLEEEVGEVSHETEVLTDVGTAGEKGLVTKKLQELVDAGRWTTSWPSARCR